jgi:hypothetical protein
VVGRGAEGVADNASMPAANATMSGRGGPVRGAGEVEVGREEYGGMGDGGGRSSAREDNEEAAAVVLAVLNVDDAIKEYLLEIARDPAIASGQALWEAVGPLVLSAGDDEDEQEVRHVVTQVFLVCGAAVCVEVLVLSV